MRWEAERFGMEIRRLRLARGLGIRGTAVAMGYGSGSVSAAWKLEWGGRGGVPGPAQMRGLASELGTCEGWLLGKAGYGVGCTCGRCGDGG